MMEALSYAALHQLVEEQAALHRVAALVAREHRAEDTFAVVSEEVGRLLDARITNMVRYGPGDRATIVSGWSEDGNHLPIGSRWSLDGLNLASLILESERPARIDAYDEASGEAAEVIRTRGIRSAVGSPIVVDGRLWGLMIAYSAEPEPLPAGTEERMASFTELVATAIANEEARNELAASRARIVTSADEARRQLERDLHDGIQQRLVALSLDIVRIRSMVARGGEVELQLERVTAELEATLQDLLEIAHGIHPAILSKGGLGPALRDLARRAALPVEIEANVDVRLPEPVEVAAYYVVSEALANTAKHAHASEARVEASTGSGRLRIVVSDDGAGGAEPSRGSGLTGLSDRVTALGGTFAVHSRPGEGTAIVVELPLGAP